MGRAWRRALCRVLVTTVFVASVVTEPLAVAGASSNQHRTVPRTARELGRTDPTQPPDTQPVEITSLRTANSDTYALPNGQRLAKIYAGPVNYLSPSTKAMEPIDDTLVPTTASGYAYTNRANGYNLWLPPDLSTPVKVSSRGPWVQFALEGASGSLSVAGPTATYHDALPNVDVSYTAANGAAKEALVLANASAPATFVYDVQSPAGLTYQDNTSGGVDVVDKRGVVIATLHAPSITDSAGATGTVTLSGSGSTLTLMAEESWLQSPARVWPVTIDPTVTFSGSGAVSDCWIGAGAPNTSNCAATTLSVGYDGTNKKRGLLQFPTLQSTLPDDSVVFSASLALYLVSKTTSNTVQIDARRVSQAWTSSATWNKYDGTHSWTTAGGDYDSTSSQYTNVGYGAPGLGSSTGVTVTWYLTKLVQDWVNGVDANQPSEPSVPEDGILLKQTGETTTQVLNFASTEYSDTSKVPVLSVRYNINQGLNPEFKTQHYQLDDRTAVEINAANGNLVIANHDIRIDDAGHALNVDRFYNANGSLGENWSFSTAPDQRIEKLADGSLLYYGPDENRAVYIKTDNTPTFATPAGQNATMIQLSSGDYQLTEDFSGEVFEFKNENTSTPFYNLIKDSDRNGNAINLSYVSGTSQLNQITDTRGLTITATYTSGELTKLQDSTGRQWQYHYNAAGLIDTYTDPASNVTTYVYNGSNTLTEIDTPDGHVIKFTSDGHGRTASVSQISDNSNPSTTTLTTNFTYYPTYDSSSGACNAAAPTYVVGCTLITDPRGGTTIDRYDVRDRVIDLTDARGKHQGLSFTTNNNVSAQTDALSHTISLSYASNNTLTQVALPSSNGTNTPATSNASFGDTHNLNVFEPTSVVDAQGNCTRYVYDSTHGDLVDVYQGLTPSGGNCDSGTGSNHYVDALNGIIDPISSATGSCTNAVSGQLCSMTDPLSHAVSYAYNSSHQVSTVTWPSPRGSWSYTYDGLSRVNTFTDGRSQQTTYSYDNLDRVTQELFNGATSCSSYTNCIQFTYDADGNLTSQIDSYGTTTFDYDDMGRLIRKTLPSSSDACAGDSKTPKGATFTYDGSNNLTTVCNALGTTGYGYNATNQLTSMYEPGGNCGGTPSKCTTFTVDDNGRRTGITYPVTNGASEAISYQDNGEPSIVQNVVNGSTVGLYGYDYATSGGQDTTVLQSLIDPYPAHIDYTYDAENRLTETKDYDGSGTLQHDWTYTLDNAGNRIKSTATGTTDMYYGYNTADALCWTKASSTSVSGSCSSPPSGATTWTSDLDGNQTGNSAGLAYSANSENQTTSMTPSGGSAISFGYTGTSQDQLTSETSGGSTTNYDNALLGADRITTGGTSTYLIRDNTGEVLGTHTGTTSTYYLFDGLGSVRQTVKADGTGLSTVTYDPFGQQLSGTIPTFGFRDGQYDAATGLYKFGDRYYDASLGRFTQPDPELAMLEQAASINRYAYAGNDPVNQSDPSGRSIWRDLWDLIAAIIATATLVAQILSWEVTTWQKVVGFAAAAVGWAVAEDHLLCKIPGVGFLCSIFG